MFARILAVGVLGLAASTAPALGQQVLIFPPRPPMPVPGVGVAQPLRVRSHRVDVTIEGAVATTRIEQVLYNPNPAIAEGTLLLPLPKEAHVERFTLDIAGNEVEAELLDADKARSIYEEIVRQTRDPALLEYSGSQLLRARVFPIEAHAEKRLTLTYSHVLPTDSGVTRYVYPMIDRTLDGRELPRLSMKVEVKADAPLANVYSPTHEVEVTRRGDRSATIGFESDRLDPRDFQLLFSAQPAGDPVALDVLTYRKPGEDRGYFAVFATPGAAPGVEIAAAPPLPKDLVFVIDTSGSMAGEKLEQAKRALRFCLASLDARDRFQVVRFSTEAQPLLAGLEPADKDHVAQAVAFVDTFKATGGTAISDALAEALSAAVDADQDDGRMRAVVFLTDGQPTLGETDPDKIVAAVDADDSPFRVFCFGIGTDINTHLLDRIAEARRAATEYVLPDEDIEVKLSRFYEKVAEPAMTDPKLSVGPHATVRDTTPPRAEDMHPRPLPDLFKGQQLVLVGRYTGDSPGEVTLSGKVAGEAVALSRDVEFPGGDAAATSHAFIPRLWATRQVGFLLDEIRLRGEKSELRDEVVALAREFGIVTPYTSHLIVEDEMRRNVTLSMRSLQLPTEDAAQLGEYYRAGQRENTGAVAVAGASEANRLRGSAQPAAPTPTPTDGALFAAKADDRFLGLEGNAAFRQQVRQVASRTFVQNGEVWTDTRAQALDPSTAAQRLTFASDEYFALLRDHPEAAGWLALGPNVRFVLDGQLIEVVDEG